MATESYTARWGILGTGQIAKSFAQDLLTPPSSRGVTSIQHVISAVASRSLPRAQAFLAAISAPSTATAYGSYTELVHDASISIIYISSPHSHHFQHAMLALRARKHVLCEKPLAVNAAQAKALVDEARAQGCFLMEAMWTRFLPLTKTVRLLVQKGTIGRVERVVAELCIDADPAAQWGPEYRMVNMDLAGGALLDLGIYPLTWVYLFLYNGTRPVVTSSMTKYATGVDETVCVNLAFQSSDTSNPTTHGTALASFRASPNARNNEAPIRIQGTLGEIQIFPYAPRPTGYRVVMKNGGVEEVCVEIPGSGLFWEADEAASCVKQGLLETDLMAWKESIDLMITMDEVRAQGELMYPNAVESTEFKGE
ncbi:MAG: hypothetical protein M1829_000087 [Trizodia sp. TS-e1964]|nr:MAG: hypothetical protein M1829_000087 [Trizodia sp. TS-e1964]